MDLHKIVKWIIPGGIILIVFGTLGFVLVEGADPFDALYMTIITITTVGYGEIIPLHRAGRIFAVFVILIGTSYILFSIGVITQVAVEGRIRRILGRRRLDSKIERMKNHYILCGFGRMGRVIAAELHARKAHLVVVERDEENIRELEELNITYVHGNATDEHALRSAGLERAKAMIVALSSDADAVFTILMAREINKDIAIVARAIDEGAGRRLTSAGATHVVSPYTTVGRSMANSVLRPEVYGILDGVLQDKDRTIRMEGCTVGVRSELAGMTLRNAPIRQKLGLIIIGIRKADGEMLFNPPPDYTIESGDVLISMGDVKNLEELARWLNPAE